jgi:hypothetical protein
LTSKIFISGRIGNVSAGQPVEFSTRGGTHLISDASDISGIGSHDRCRCAQRYDEHQTKSFHFPTPSPLPFCHSSTIFQAPRAERSLTVALLRRWIGMDYLGTGLRVLANCHGWEAFLALPRTRGVGGQCPPSAQGMPACGTSAAPSSNASSPSVGSGAQYIAYKRSP